MIEDFTMATLDNGIFNEGSSMGAPFNRGSNEGGATLTIDNMEMYITICGRADGEGSCDIYYTRMVDDEWEVPVNMNSFNPNINTLQWESQVSISSDGKTLYFAAHREEGYGGIDLYKIIKDEAGQWSDPINLGPNINSNQDDKHLHTTQIQFHSFFRQICCGPIHIFRSRTTILHELARHCCRNRRDAGITHEAGVFCCRCPLFSLRNEPRIARKPRIKNRSASTRSVLLLIRDIRIIRGSFLHFFSTSRRCDSGNLSCLPRLCGCVTLLLIPTFLGTTPAR